MAIEWEKRVEIQFVHVFFCTLYIFEHDNTEEASMLNFNFSSKCKMKSFSLLFSSWNVYLWMHQLHFLLFNRLLNTFLSLSRITLYICRVLRSLPHWTQKYAKSRNKANWKQSSMVAPFNKLSFFNCLPVQALVLYRLPLWHMYKTCSMQNKMRKHY